MCPPAGSSGRGDFSLLLFGKFELVFVVANFTESLNVGFGDECGLTLTLQLGRQIGDDGINLFHKDVSFVRVYIEYNSFIIATQGPLHRVAEEQSSFISSRVWGPAARLRPPPEAP